MAGPARRDLVWDAALRALVSNPASIRLRDVQIYIDEAEVSNRTVRRTMSAMQALGWLEKDKEGGHFWYPGPKAREFLLVPGHDEIGSQSGCTVQSNSLAVQKPRADEIGEAIETIDVHAEGSAIAQRRRNLMSEILYYIRDRGEVSPSEIRARFYPGAEGEAEPNDAADSVGYSSAESWWKNFVYATLSDVDLVETGGEGSHTWFYVGEN